MGACVRERRPRLPRTSWGRLPISWCLAAMWGSEQRVLAASRLQAELHGLRKLRDQHTGCTSDVCAFPRAGNKTFGLMGRRLARAVT